MSDCHLKGHLHSFMLLERVTYILHGGWEGQGIMTVEKGIKQLKSIEDVS